MTQLNHADFGLHELNRAIFGVHEAGRHETPFALLCADDESRVAQRAETVD